MRREARAMAKKTNVKQGKKKAKTKGELPESAIDRVAGGALEAYITVKGAKQGPSQS
jgi:hypothetical protein